MKALYSLLLFSFLIADKAELPYSKEEIDTFSELRAVKMQLEQEKSNQKESVFQFHALIEKLEEAAQNLEGKIDDYNDIIKEGDDHQDKEQQYSKLAVVYSRLEPEVAVECIQDMQITELALLVKHLSSAVLANIMANADKVLKDKLSQILAQK